MEKHNMLNCWFSLASVLFFITANASEDPNASLIVPYQFDTKRFYLSQSNNITGFCYNNSLSSGYWCSIEDEGSPYLTPVPHVYKGNLSFHYFFSKNIYLLSYRGPGLEVKL